MAKHKRTWELTELGEDVFMVAQLLAMVGAYALALWLLF